MKLLTAAITRSMPALYSTEQVPTPEKVVRVKWFLPASAWTWYGIEMNPEDREVFGMEVGDAGCGLTYWEVSTLEELRAPRPFTALQVERDLHFTPRPLRDVDDPAVRDYLDRMAGV